MKNILRHILIIFMLVCISAEVAAQKSSHDLYQDHITDILPLKILIDSAINNSPQLKYYNLEVENSKIDLALLKKEWGRNIGVEVNAKYGSIDDIIINELPDGSSYGSNYNSVNMRYSAGLFMKIPLYEFTGRKEKIQYARNIIGLKEMKKKELAMQIKVLTIKHYNNLFLAYNLVKVKGAAKESSLIQVEMAEMEFKDGLITIYELSKILEANSKALSEFEKSKSDYRTSYLILEEICGITLKK